MTATITTAYRVIVHRRVADVAPVYVVHRGFCFSGALDAVDGAVGVVEGWLGVPVTGILSVEVQRQQVMFRGAPDEDQIDRCADEDDWSVCGDDDWDYATRILRHPVARRRTR